MKEVRDCLTELQQHFNGNNKKLQVSDVVDDKGHQYVNLVQKGGGVLGVALVGYTYVLEQMGIRFIRLAGTSAGAINTALMTIIGAKKENGIAKGDKVKAKSEEVLGEICNLNFFDLVDGHPVARWMIRNVITDENFSKIVSRWCMRAVLILLALFAGDIVFTGLASKFPWAGVVSMICYLLTGFHILVLLCILFYILYLVKRLKNAGFGINPGDFFYDWMKKLMIDNGVENTTDLRNVASTPVPGLKITGERTDSIDDLQGDVTFITSEIVSQNKIEFPLMAELFKKNINDVHPAGFVRASMAIPIFFESYFIDEIPATDPHIAALWKDMLGVEGDIPATARFVDGGVLSNFPLNLFYNPHIDMPRLPSFGIDLDDEKLPAGTKVEEDAPDDCSNKPQQWSFGGYLYRIFNTVRFYYDKDFLIKNAFFKKGIGTVPLKGYNWLNFFMTNEQKKEMFLQGVRAAADFLKNFNWDEYKSKRVEMYKKVTQ
ncbi:MAG: patatin-like phospholipase family protein [Chitinophagaceae bacterium]|nr:patatin-like phospholipase family protein [Chitinophagaceae bacterium]